MSNVFLSHNNIISALGFSSEANVQKIHDEITGLQVVSNEMLLNEPFCSSLVNQTLLEKKFQNLHPKGQFTRLEKMMIASLSPVILASKIELDTKVGFLISTTKGNIDVLDKNSPFPTERAYLSVLGRTLKTFFGFANEPTIVCNACVSGILSVAVAKQYIQQGLYDHVFIVSGDLVTEFILSGFNSFQALSKSPCKPYDKNRSGINIGEVAASILVTKDEKKLAKESVQILGTGSCNDANHISGPSRTGEGLYRSVLSALGDAKIDAQEVDFISAHGTATIYNDEMESIAFNRLGLSKTPLNSLKGYFGHTLGASGLLETIVGVHSLNNNTLYASIGYEESGVSLPINVIQKTEEKNLNVFLKTASGFGGSNTAALFKKII